MPRFRHLFLVINRGHKFHILRFKSQLSRFTKQGLFRTVFENMKRVEAASV